MLFKYQLLSLLLLKVGKMLFPFLLLATNDSDVCEDPLEESQVLRLGGWHRWP